MALPPSPAALAYCGTEPPFYDKSDGLPSLAHSSWELCLQSYARNHPPTYAPSTPDPVFTVPIPPPTPRPIADSLQMWLAQHTDLSILIAALVLLAIGLILFALVRRSARRAKRT